MAKKQELPKSLDEALSIVENTAEAKIVHTYFGIQREGLQNQVIQLDELNDGKFKKTILLSNTVLAICIKKLDEMVVRTTTIKKQF